ncbi:alanine racemase [Aerococcus kribbianus]|uniref:Alanine racemase n=1 Tax=Aerococcus kribbianus TaxID=2999064 RepID=A0A9X3JFN8_9LACT|nr:MULTISPECIES: alanine racemase [unclassified Aerococcus]MCZ0717262.1 alanine racemase [Aerococcus sp. YH-aer221]MCZ0725550.1 alanine racemase [Aerococcus sp. YH-aer222]
MIPGINRPSAVHVSKTAVLNNYHKIKDALPEGTKVLAVVKADAYGHGAVPLSLALSESGVDGFCVAISDEARELRQAGIIEPLYILGLTPAEEAWNLAQEEIGVTVSSLDYLKKVIALAPNQVDHPLLIHLKADTGMGRIGLNQAEDLQILIDFISDHQDYLQLESVFTHFATADTVSDYDQEIMNQQNQAFQAIRAKLDFSQLKQHPFFHQSNSALSLWHPDLTLDAARLGIAMYGVNTTNYDLDLPYSLEAALSLTTEIVYCKKVAPGQTISYGATYQAESQEWIATLPIGYADGWPRCMTGFEVLVDGHPCPIVGRVCMDQCMIRLPHHYPIGTPVTLIGHNKDKVIAVEDIAKYANTIGHEILCGLSNRLPRIYH